MATKLHDHVMGTPVIAATYAVRKSSRAISSKPFKSSQSCMRSPVNVSSKRNSVLKRMNKLGKTADGFAHGIREHVRLSPKISETVKGKLSLGARILQVGGMEKVFRHLFSVREGERLMKASQCYLSTTAGPIAGLLFISTEKVAFCSERSIKLPSPNGEFARIRYKVSIPLSKIEEANQSQNVERPSEKYIQIVTVDSFDFWFMGFLNHHKTLKHLQRAISQA
ncbi:GEM-like protein 4 [Rhodamnia argentea]|uniref:GEM-like protein 4 n=1 Tax=Rhodamnia argentea TaxID=178133 RepID=A0A8B8QCQ7_9MYRT|nr:GEM-like protein 4 [Rhodamnia argentea]